MDVDKCLNLLKGSATKDGGTVALHLSDVLQVSKYPTLSFDALQSPKHSEEESG